MAADLKTNHWVFIHNGGHRVERAHVLLEQTIIKSGARRPSIIDQAKALVTHTDEDNRLLGKQLANSLHRLRCLLSQSLPAAAEDACAHVAQKLCVPHHERDGVGQIHMRVPSVGGPSPLHPDVLCDAVKNLHA